MEHRRGRRLPNSNLVCIHCHKVCLGNFNVKNISNGGISIIDSDELLSKGDFLEIQFYDENRHLSSNYAKAIVVNYNKSNVGLMLVEDSNHIINIIKNIVKAAA